METRKAWDERLFLIAYVLWMLYAVLNITLWCKYDIVSIICGYMRRTAFLLLLIRILIRRRYTVKDVIGIFLIIFCNIISRNSVYNLQIITTSIFVYCATDVKFEKILKATFAVQTAVMVVTVAAAQVGILENLIWEDGVRIRYSLGYEYCGYPAHLLLFMTLIWFCIRKKAYLFDAAIWLGLNYVMYRWTVSRTDFYLAVLGIAGFFVWGRTYQSQIINRFRDFITKHGFTLAALLSVAAHFFYNSNNALHAKINYVLNGRLQLGYNAIQEYGFSLFGEKIKWIGQGGLRANPERVYNYVDNAFLKETLSYGIVFMIVLAVGYYLVGRRIARSSNYTLGWAVLVSLAYGVINAHLCIMTFNVFILLLGEVFELDKEIARNSIPELLTTLYPARLPLRTKRMLRVGVLIVVFGYLTYVQIGGNSYMVGYRAFHRWIICGLLFLLSFLCAEGGQRKNGDKTLSCLTAAFLFIGCISDFFLDKKFSNSSFFMLLFGGMLICSWGRMKQPNQLIEEFKWAYKIWFGLAVLLCIAFRPALPGICYSGIFPSADSFGIAMLIAAAVFLGDCEKGRWAILNTGGAVVSLYFIWTTQHFLLAAISVLLVGGYFIFKISYLIGLDKRCHGIYIMESLAGMAFGILCVFLMRKLLYNISPLSGFAVALEKDTVEYIEYTIPQLLQNGAWMDVISEKLELFGEYILYTNVIGHDYVAKIGKRQTWPDNGLLMSLYRYGVVAAVPYAGMLIVYFWRALLHTIRKRDFFIAGMAVVCISVSMVETIEMPFVHMGWFVFYFVLAWLLVLDKGEANEIFEHKD